MRTQFLFSEIGIGLRRNFTMTVAVVLTIAISVVLLGTAWILREHVNSFEDALLNQVEISVYLTKDVTQGERQAIEQRLTGLPQVKSVRYLSKDDAYQRFKKDFANEPDLVNNTSADALPESYVVQLKDPHKFAVISSAMQGEPGVDQVTNASQVLNGLFRLLRSLQRGAFGLAVVLLIGAALLIYNAIRVAAYSRRRETGIMRLVGASNAYIRLPFIIESMAAGFVGAALAIGGLYGIQWFINAKLVHQFNAFSVFGEWGPFYSAVGIAFGVGLLLPALASLLTLQRHLRA